MTVNGESTAAAESVGLPLKGVSRAGRSWGLRGFFDSRQAAWPLLVPAACLFALGLLRGMAMQGDSSRPASVLTKPGTTEANRPAAAHPEPVGPKPAAPKPKSEFKALLEFAHERIREGHLLAAKAACEKIIAGADEEAAEKASLALETVEARMRAQNTYLDEAKYKPFVDGLAGSSSRINGLSFHGSMYNVTPEEARAAFAQFLRTRNMTHELRINAKYPLYFWGSNHRSLQYGLAHGTVDVIRAMIREGGNITGLAKIIESRRGMGASFDRSLDFIREIAGRKDLTPAQKGELYWRTRRRVLTLAPKNTDDAPPAVKKLLAALGSTLSRLEPFKDSFDPDKTREVEGHEVF